MYRYIRSMLLAYMLSHIHYRPLCSPILSSLYYYNYNKVHSDISINTYYTHTIVYIIQTYLYKYLYI